MDFDALVRRLEQEAQGLREAMAVAQVRLKDIDQFLELGQRLATQPSPPNPFQEGAFAFTTSTRRERILSAAESVLSDGRRRTTHELLHQLHGLGISPGGADPVQNLSSYLSRSELFSSDTKRGGWTLASMAQRDELARQLHALAHGVPASSVLHETALDQMLRQRVLHESIETVNSTLTRDSRETKG